MVISKSQLFGFVGDLQGGNGMSWEMSFNAEMYVVGGFLQGQKWLGGPAGSGACIEWTGCRR